MSKEKNSVLDFNLGDLKYFKANSLFHDSKREHLDKFVLSISLAHNDIRGFLLYWDILQENQPEIPPNDKISAKLGMVSGLKWFVYRYLVGVLCEIMVLIENNLPLLQDETFNKTLGKLDTNYQKSWNQLFSLARKTSVEGDDNTKRLRNKISKIRDSVVFHYNYNGDTLLEGYKLAFSQSKRPDCRAFFTIGSSLETNCFLYSDAVIETVMKETFNVESLNRGEDEVVDFIRNAHVAIAMFLQKYFNQIQASVITLGPADKLYNK